MTERPQAGRALAAEPAEAAEFFRVLSRGHLRPQLARMPAISALMSAGSGRLGGRTSARHRPSWARASLTTLTLSAEESAPRSSSNRRTDSQIFIAAPKSLPRSASSMARARAGLTLARPEVKPCAPHAQYAGAVRSAAPGRQGK